MPTTLPDSRTLTGPDYMMLAMDRRMRHLTGAGNICHLILDLEGILSSSQLRTRLDSLEGVLWLGRSRLRSRLPFQVPHWTASGKVAIPIHEVDASSLETTLQTLDHAPTQQPLLSFHLCQEATSTRLVMSWQHGLFDSRGAELLLDAIGHPEAELPTFWAAPPAPPRPFLKALERSREVKVYMEKLSAAPLTVLPKQSGETGPYNQTLRFSAEETASIDKLASGAGAMFMKSLYLLAAVGGAVQALAHQRGLPPGDLLVPVPHDRRKKGGTIAISPNLLSFLFFRIAPSAKDDVTSTVKDLTGQLQTTMRSGILDDYDDFLGLARHLPLSFYTRMIYSSADGCMASFCFSDTGNVAPTLSDSFLELPVQHLEHRAPNSTPPGLTTVCYRVDNCLQIGIGADTRYVQKQEVELLVKELRTRILGKNNAE